MDGLIKGLVDVALGGARDRDHDERDQDHQSPDLEKDQWQRYKKPASEQEYRDEVEIDGSWEPSEEELENLSEACNRLWELDFNRLVPGKDYEIDTGAAKKIITIHEEKQEQAAFIEEISRTAPIKYLHQCLSSKGIASGTNQDFNRMMTSIWFDLYDRGGTSGSSSAFEHVFVGEINQRGKVSGFHNWLQFYLEEAKGNVDYQGYIFPRRNVQIPDSETQLLTIQFEWNGIIKSVSSTLVGVSPEFEIALYILCG